MKKKIILSLTSIIIITILLYFFNDGWIIYNLQKNIYTPQKLIYNYTNLLLPDDIKLQNLVFTEDSPDCKDEAVEITVLVPTDDIDNLFKKENRDYNTSRVSLRKIEENNTDSVNFSYNKFDVVRKWFTYTQRSVQFIVMQPVDEYSKIYISIDKLGWLPISK